MPSTFERRSYLLALSALSLVYLHNTLPHLTMMPRVNVDEPWLMERAYQVMRTGIPSQPMLGLKTAYLLQVGYGYLLAPWMTAFGVGLFQARLFNAMLGLGTVLLVASIGRRTVSPLAGLAAAAFLALDSNFLGGARNARTDIPSVFFVTAALAAYVVARQRERGLWFAISGACLGLALLVHGNAFWAGLILFAWYLLDYGLTGFVRSFGYWFIGGVLVTFGPYLAVVLSRWHDVQAQIGNFAGDRVPAWRPSVILHQATLEIDRYRGWYFGLVTNAVPNPLLWAFKLATVVGIVLLVFRALRGPARTVADPKSAPRLLILAVGTAIIFACFINNKVPVYMPHLLIGFSLAAGFAVNEVSGLLPGFSWLGPACVALYAVAGVGYYEKWYSSASKSELLPYESTEATLRVLMPAGSKYVYASPQFWTPFHAEPGTDFLSYAEAQPLDESAGQSVVLAGAASDRAIVLLIDEFQWLPELTNGVSQPTTSWQKDWVKFVENHCALEAEALGTAHGTIAAYSCVLSGKPQPPPVVRVVGATTDYAAREPVLSQSAQDLARWTKYDDPRRPATATPSVDLTPEGLRISGTGWPGIVKMFDATPGNRYLVRTQEAMTRDGDLLYLGTWQQPQVRSLAGGSSSGIGAPFVAPRWFPHERAFAATAPQVRVLIYSEAPSTDFVISSLDILRLQPADTTRTAGTR
ncbi:MAG TPA: glycosyltransferase family 39 protein [Vicinamibacterales bacterium]|nr:glycosyltransferase family 39 protein [Vicinamibacterales bacterium]